jgi:hypothetical protein
MAINNQAAQQIGSLLTQAGIPAGHAADISQRLISTFQSDSLNRSADSSRLISAEQARLRGMQNSFRPPETPYRSYGDRASKDGLKGANGKGGAAGEDGMSGFNGIAGAAGTNGTNGTNGADGQVDYDIVREMVNRIVIELLGGGGGGKDYQKQIDALQKQIDALRKQLGGQGKCGPGKFPGQDPCKVLEQQATEIGKLRKDFKDLDKRVKEIEKKLEDTIDCPKV